ncbi:uncharacterized protein DNG_07243 [Cephalotrichum gorgonifer]|uniref:Heterokaryon incompatibility domain-containing protein n=1 Tax=Cephalotrichum gorgonifer TaxID=2041049 RepID=A0AAE8SX96_9PEZI|nr:uncharacterized protein DNG_07243 [Cephalotrichum gorgonifer]
MRLLNANTIKLEEFNEADAPPYAILSHTWGSQEVTFQEIQGDGLVPGSKAAGYEKISRTCRQALKQGLGYAWVDTCCIDKSSSAELSEAINSMFRWYQNAWVCYTYLSDVPSAVGAKSILSKSRWFTRGWTLQELLAPRRLVFFAADWHPIGTRGSLGELVSQATGIPGAFLRDDGEGTYKMPRGASVAQRMSWASRRQTTRPEDLAYCLLGIFGINMPLLYGEGRNAFVRLQEEIIRHTDDQSVFAWAHPGEPTIGSRRFDGDARVGSLLAPSPEYFGGSGDIMPADIPGESAPFSLTSRGVRANLRVFRGDWGHVGILHCRRSNELTTLLAIAVTRESDGRLAREVDQPLQLVNFRTWSQTPAAPNYLRTGAAPENSQIPEGCLIVEGLPERLRIRHVSKGFTWSASTGLITRDSNWVGGTYVTRWPEDFVLHIFLQPKPPKDSPYDLVTVTVRVRRLHSRTELVACRIEHSKCGQPVAGVNQLPERFFATVRKLDLFGRKAFVIEISEWKDELRLLERRLPLLQMRLRSFLSNRFFDFMDATNAWRALQHWEPILEFALAKPACGIALRLTLWPPSVPQLLRWTDMIANATTRRLPQPAWLWAVILSLRLAWSRIGHGAPTRRFTSLLLDPYVAVLVILSLLSINLAKWILLLEIITTNWTLPLLLYYVRHRSESRPL